MRIAGHLGLILILAGLGKTALARDISPNVQITSYYGNAFPNAPAATGGCPDGTLRYYVDHWDGGFSISFESKPEFFTVDSRNWDTSHGSCSADVTIRIPNSICYSLDTVSISGSANIYEGETLALAPTPQTHRYNAATNTWDYVDSFHPKDPSAIDVKGPGAGLEPPFFRAAHPVNLLNNNADLNICDSVSQLNLDLQALFIFLDTGKPVSTAHIERYIYTFKTRAKLVIDPRFPIGLLH